MPAFCSRRPPAREIRLHSSAQLHAFCATLSALRLEQIRTLYVRLENPRDGHILAQTLDACLSEAEADACQHVLTVPCAALVITVDVPALRQRATPERSPDVPAVLL